MEAEKYSNAPEGIENRLEESLGSVNLVGKTDSPLSSDPVWRQVQSLVLNLTETGSEKSIVGARTIPETFADITKLAIAPNLLPHVGISTKKTRTSDPRTALLEHRRLVAVIEIFLEFISMKNVYGQILITSELSKILVALMQLCYAPIRSVPPSEAAIPTTIRGWLEHGDLLDESIVSVEFVVAEMHRDRERLLAQLHKLTDSLFQPAVIESFLRMLDPNIPVWLKKAVSSHLSRELVRPRGLASFLCAMGQVFDRDTPWLQLEKAALLVTRPPSTMSDREYTENMSRQLKTILQSDNQKSEMTLLVAILNAFFSHKPDLSSEFLLRECFSDFVNLLLPEFGTERLIHADQLRKHLEMVRFSCDVLPKDSALLEILALFMPFYLSLATAADESKSKERKIYLETIVRLTSRLSEGVDVIIACLDPNDQRFQLADGTSIAFDANGNVKVAQRQPLRPPETSYETLFGKLFEIDEALTCEICLRLMDFYQNRDDAKLTANSDFWRVCLPLMMKSIEVCKERIERNEEFAVRTIINNISGINESEHAQETLKLVEVLLRSENKLSDENARRLRASVRHLARIEGELESKAIALSNEILKQYNNVEPFRLEPRFLTWKCAPRALKLIANKGWILDESSAPKDAASEYCSSKSEFGDQQEPKSKAKSVFGTMSEYRKVRDELMDPDVAIRGHGFIELRKLLAARDTQAGNDLEYLCELCKVALKEEDSYIYLGAVQCFALIVAWRTREYLPDLLDLLKSSQDDAVRMKLSETLLRCISSFGDMSPVYCEKIVTSIVECFEDGTADLATKCAAASLLGQSMGFIPNRGLLLRQVVNTLVTLITFDEDEIVRRAAACGLAEGLKRMDKVVLINDYPTEVRDIHRVIRGLFGKCDDDTLKIHLQEILLTLGDVARTCVQGSAAL